MARGVLLNLLEIQQLKDLRRSGHTLLEIRKATGRAYDTVYKYVRDVEISKEHRAKIKSKQGGGKARSLRQWKEAQHKAARIFSGNLSRRDKILVLASLYWGEGTKKEFSIINSDGELLRTVVGCMRELGVTDTDLAITLRVFEEADIQQTILYWSNVLNIDRRLIKGINVVHGKKKGKLPYGMCRIRIKKGAEYFKLIMSVIHLLKLKFCQSPRSSMDRASHS